MMNHRMASNKLCAILSSNLGLIIECIILTGALVAVGCSKTHFSGVLQPKGFRTSKTLDGVTGNNYHFGETTKIFLVITLVIPEKDNIPTEDQYLMIKSIREANTPSAGESKTATPPRQNCRFYSAERFTLILAGGREYQGELIAKKNNTTNGFGQYVNLIFSQAAEVDKSSLAAKNETIKVAFIVDEKDVKPPFLIRFDHQAPVAVPEKKLE